MCSGASSMAWKVAIKRWFRRRRRYSLLGYDVHAEILPLMHRLVEDPPNKAARKEAIRLLAADPAAVDSLVEIVRDKREDPDVRRTAAIALQSIAPDVQG